MHWLYSSRLFAILFITLLLQVHLHLYCIAAQVYMALSLCTTKLMVRQTVLIDCTTEVHRLRSS